MSRTAARTIGPAIATVLLACAGGGAPGPVSQAPHEVEGEAVRGPEGDAEVVAAVDAAGPQGANRLDFNGDRHVDREEFRNFFARSFHSADANDDRLLAGDELTNVPADAAQQADHDSDGAIDVDEYVTLSLVWFERCDRNDDDVLGPDEEQSCSETRPNPR